MGKNEFQSFLVLPGMKQLPLWGCTRGERASHLKSGDLGKEQTHTTKKFMNEVERAPVLQKEIT